MSFRDQLYTALERPSIRDSTTAVHELVANAIVLLDPGIRVSVTDYLNHSFVPDLVLRWEASGKQQSRDVHLRFSVTGEGFLEDLSALGRDQPVFLGMTDVDHGGDNLGGSAVETRGSLVTQTAAVDEFASAVRREARSRKVTSPIIRAGHGFIGEPQAERVTRSFDAALTNVSQGDERSARESVVLLSGVLDPLLTESGQIEFEKGLQTEWIRSGLDPHDFPSSTPSSRPPA